MGSNASVLNDNGYTIVSEQEKMMLAKNKNDDQFAIKKLSAIEEDISKFLQKLDHPHIVHPEKLIPDKDCLYLVLEHCEGGDLAQTIQLKKEKDTTFYEMMTKSGDQTSGVNTVNKSAMENSQILDWTVKICMALKHLHDQQVLHKNLQPKSIFFTASGTIRLGEFGQINEWSANTQNTQTEDFSYVAPENLNDSPFDEKSEVWSLGCIIYEMCMLRCAFTGRSTRDIIPKIRRGSYEDLPNTFSADLRQLVKDTLQVDPMRRPSVSEILTRPFILKHLYEKSKQTIEELKVRKPLVQDSQEKPEESKVSLKVLEEVADSLENVHYGTTVGSLTGGVVGLTGGITSLVGLVLAPFTFGASLIVTGVGIGTAVAGGVTAGVSNVTKIVNQNSNRQNMKMIIRAIKEKICSTSLCIQNLHIAVEYLQNEFTETNTLNPSKQSESNQWVNAGARLGRSLGGIGEIVRLAQVARVGKVAAQTARVVRVAEAATGVLSGLFVAVDVLFIALDAKEIHRLRQDYASMEAQKKSSTNNEQELQSEILKFVKKIRETTEELEETLNELQNELMQTQIVTHYKIGF